MSLLSTSHTYSFKRTKNILHTILLSICFVFANSAFATSNPVIPNVAVGDLLQGGVVYYVAPTPTDLDGDGKVDIGLICAVEDQSAAIEWILGGASQTTENGNTSTAIGTGQTNTTAMMNQAGYTGGAAQVADD